MIDFARVLTGSVVCIGLGATAALADSAALARFAGAKERVISYYAANAREGAGNCGPGQITDIGDARVLSESGDHAVVAVNYAYSARATGGNTALCSGDAIREFTLARNGAGWLVSGMTGQMP